MYDLSRNQVAFIVIVMLVTAPTPRMDQRASPAPANPIAVGRKIYEKEKCATCHQIAHQGNGRYPLDRVGSKLSDVDIRRWITDTARMESALPVLPPLRMSSTQYKLKPADLDALVAYLASLK